MKRVKQASLSLFRKVAYEDCFQVKKKLVVESNTELCVISHSALTEQAEHSLTRMEKSLEYCI